MGRPNTSAPARCDTWSIFKQNLMGLNSEFSFSKTGFITKVNEDSLLNC